MKKIVGFIMLMVFLLSFSTVASATTYLTNQDCTAYCWTGDRMANGSWPEIGYVAVHPTVAYGATPKIPFGTFLYVDSVNSDSQGWDDAIHSPEGYLSVVCVGDMGDLGYYFSNYWLDIYFGSDEDAADDWGIGTISYHYN